MSELEDLSCHISGRISSLQRVLDLSVSECPQNRMKELKQEVLTLERLLEDFEKCVEQQKKKLKHLKEYEETFQKDLEDIQHIRSNIPAHVPRKRGPANCCESLNQTEAADVNSAKVENVKKTNKNFVKEMEFITLLEFESIPKYMKGLVTYDQVNSTVQSINTAVTAKYSVLHQSIKKANSHARKLHQRFKDQETKDTKGLFFVVEDDIREFSQMKVDKRFQRIVTMLRHCKRLQEIRGGGLTRYMLL